ncbi:MAG: enoyl-ACP reductase FabI [Corynebacteriales bacterium]|nr:enoyl-ACP reductase FabI [Mycobacteriales bacterium]
MTGLVAGKKLLITGVLTDSSIGFSVAKLAQEQGAQVVLTGFGRMSLVERVAKRLPEPAPVVELDVTNEEQLASLPERLSPHIDGLDGLLHSIGFAPQSCLGGGFMDAPWEDVATALQVSTFSFKSLAVAAAPMMREGGSIVGMDFDATKAFPAYDWMGVAKAGLESVSRYMARELGPQKIRVNLVAAGPIRTMAAKSIPGFAQFEQVFADRAPLGWDISDPEPTARAALSLLSDWFPATTGEIVHVDGGFHAMAA